MRIRVDIGIQLIVVLTLIVVWPGMALAGMWQGEEVVTDGVTHVMNPPNPVEDPTTVSPEELWRILGDEEDEFFFGVLTQITLDAGGNVYLLDAQLNQVMIFSPKGKFLRAIGREGEGPGEFRNPSDLFWTTDGNVAVMQRMPGKIVVLTPDGDPVGDLPVPEAEDGGFQMFSGGGLAGDNVILSVNRFARKEDGFETIALLFAVDAGGNEKARFIEQHDKRDFANMVMDEKKLMGGALVWSAAPDGRVFTSDDFDAYQITVWNPDGTVDRVVEREFQHRDRSAEEMERNAPVVRLRRGNRVQTPEMKTSKTDRDVQQIFPRDDGSIWVLSSRGAFDAADGVVGTFDVFDRAGQFTRQVTINGAGDYGDDGLYLVKDRLYVVTGLRSARRAMFGGGEGGEDEQDADDEPMSVICYDLGPMIQTMK